MQMGIHLEAEAEKGLEMFLMFAEQLLVFVIFLTYHYDWIVGIA